MHDLTCGGLCRPPQLGLPLPAHLLQTLQLSYTMPVSLVKHLLMRRGSFFLWTPPVPSLSHTASCLIIDCSLYPSSVSYKEWVGAQWMTSLNQSQTENTVLETGNQPVSPSTAVSQSLTASRPVLTCWASFVANWCWVLADRMPACEELRGGLADNWLSLERYFGCGKTSWHQSHHCPLIAGVRERSPPWHKVKVSTV